MVKYQIISLSIEAEVKPNQVQLPGEPPVAIPGQRFILPMTIRYLVDDWSAENELAIKTAVGKSLSIVTEMNPRVIMSAVTNTLTDILPPSCHFVVIMGNMMAERLPIPSPV